MDLLINQSLCADCKACENVCLMVNNFGFKSIKNVPEELCIHCGHCAAVCKTSAINLGTIKPVEILPEDFPSSEQLLNLIIKNRSLRLYQNKPVPQNAWDKIIQAIRYSSTSMNFQEVKLVIVQTHEKMKKISSAVFITLKLLRQLYHFPLTNLFLKLRYSKEVMQYLKTNAARDINILETGKDPVLYNAPGLLLLAAPSNSPSSKDDCDIAAVNINLLASSMGCCYIGGIPHSYLLNNRELKKIIPLPYGFSVFQALTIGYPRLIPKFKVQKKEKQVIYI